MRILMTVAALLAATAAHGEALEGKKESAEILAESAAEDWRALDPESTLYIELESGRVVVALSEALAPNHVARIRELARDGFYDGLTFYRVIDGFVAQGGDALGAKGEQPGIDDEWETEVGKDFEFFRLNDADGYADAVGFKDTLPVGFDKKTKTAWHLHCTGAFAFGRGNERNSASTEFYVTLQPQRYLDRNLSVFGRVVYGMQHLQALPLNNPPQSEDDDLGAAILAMRIAADVPEAERTQLEILDSARPVFADYIESRRNRAGEFFYYRPDYADVCQIPIPVRPVAAAEEVAPEETDAAEDDGEERDGE